MTTPIWGNKHFDTLRRDKCSYNGVYNLGEIEDTFSVSGYQLGISDDNILYVLGEKKLYAIDTANGTINWEYDLPDTTITTNAINTICFTIDSSGNLYFFTNVSETFFGSFTSLTSLTKNGVLRWTFDFDYGYYIYGYSTVIGGWATFSFVMSETTGKVYVATFGGGEQDDKIYAVNSIDGTLSWSKNVPEEIGASSLCLIDGTIPKIFISYDVGIKCIEDNYGYLELWTYLIPQSDPYTHISVTSWGCKIDSSENVYFTEESISYPYLKKLICINNGAKIWENNLNDFAPNLPMVIDEINNKIYYFWADPNDVLYYTYLKEIDMANGITIRDINIYSAKISPSDTLSAFLSNDGYLFGYSNGYNTQKQIFKIGISSGYVAFIKTISSLTEVNYIMMDLEGHTYLNSTDGVLKIGVDPNAYEPANVYSVAVSQNHNNLVPFQFIAENGFEDNSKLSFVISSDSGEGIFSSNTTTSTIVSDTYIPETLDSKYKHEPYAYVDIISGDQSGIKEVNTRIENEIYSYKTPTDFFNIPKFTWNNDLFEEESETSDNDSGYLWVGTNDKTLNRIYYNKFFAQNVVTANFTSDVTSEVYKIYFNPTNSDMYVSGYDHLTKYSVNNYVSGTKAAKSIEISNTDNDIIVYSNSSNIISVQSYLGNVVARDRLTLSIVNTYSGFDAPFKVIKSPYHNCYFVAGTYFLWKLDFNGTKKAVYNIKNYKIIDVDCSENGKICLLLDNGKESIIRILDKDIYSIVKENKSSEDKVRFCKYCNNNKFYILCENYNKVSSSIYNSIHYVSDIKEKTLDRYSFETNIVTTTTTTTQLAPTQKIEIIKPNGNEIIEKGSNYDITWQTTESVSDLISIELYKDNKVFDVISSANVNVGRYSWLVPTSYESDDTYQIKITWLNATNGFADISSSNFSILSNSETTATTTGITEYLFTCIGIDYSVYNNYVVIVTNTGLLGLFDLSANDFYGVFDFGILNVNAMGMKDGYAKQYPGNTKVRIFVGTEAYLNNKWDSGEIETELTSMYYGGGNNLVPGEKYYVNLQVYSEEYGWSEVQTQEWIMPK